MSTFAATPALPKLPYHRAAELDAQQAGAAPRRWPVVIVGAGPVGLTAAIDLAQSGIEVLVLDAKDAIATGSRAVCHAKRTLEIYDRIGCGDAIAQRGVGWNVGRTFFGTQEVFNFHLNNGTGHRRPGMLNLQQFHVEAALIARAAELPKLHLRWRSTVIDVQRQPGHTVVRVESPDGAYTLHADWLIACDGSRSTVRHMLGLDMDGRIFLDRFLIADVLMKSDFPAERWFWFDPPFHPGKSVLLHRQADNVFRIDFQLGWDADPTLERDPERVRARVAAMLGPEQPFEIVWISVYTFQCRRMQRFHHGRVLFAGDAAHQVSPFGARGGNSGVQDADNLAWKLRMVLQGKAPASLLESYSAERSFAADENIHNSTRSTEFITPKNEASLALRNAVLHLAREHAFARQLVNSGRLSVPSILTTSPLNTLDVDVSPATIFLSDTVPGAPAEDAPVQRWNAAAGCVEQPPATGTDDESASSHWLLSHLHGGGFHLIYCAQSPNSTNAVTIEALQRLRQDTGDALQDDYGLTGSVSIEPIIVACSQDTVVAAATVGSLQPAPKSPNDMSGVNAAQHNIPVLIDHQGLVRQRWDLRPGNAYLIRPDQHVAARWRKFDAELIRRATARATGHEV